MMLVYQANRVGVNWTLLLQYTLFSFTAFSLKRSMYDDFTISQLKLSESQRDRTAKLYLTQP